MGLERVFFSTNNQNLKKIFSLFFWDGVVGGMRGLE